MGLLTLQYSFLFLATVNMDGTAIGLPVYIIYLAQVSGHSLDAGAWYVYEPTVRGMAGLVAISNIVGNLG